MVRAMALLLLAVSMSAADLRAATVRVPQEFTSIQMAINAAVAGDEILVSPGTYYENIAFNGKALQLIAVEGPLVTVIDGSDLDSVVRIDRSEGPGTEIRGFTVRNGYASSIIGSRTGNGGGIQCVGSCPLIVGNIIESNFAERSGGGVSAFGADVTIRDNVIRDNQAGQGGGVHADAGVLIQETELNGNGALAGALSFYGPGSFHVESSTIVANGAWGIWAVGGAEVFMSECEITANKEYGFLARLGAVGILIRCSLRRNEGTAVAIEKGSSAKIIGCIITENDRAAVDSDAERCEIVNCSILGNTRDMSRDSAAVRGWGIRKVTNSIIWGNRAGSIEVGDPSDLEVSYSCIEGGWEGVGNVDVDPEIVDRSDFGARLRITSPCVDAGFPATDGLPVYDFEGDARVIGTRVDIGADEMNAGIAVRFGNILDGDGQAVGVLRINGEFGDHDRVIRVSSTDSVWFKIGPPPLGPDPAPFVVYGWLGGPDVRTVEEQRYDLGWMAFSTPLGGSPTPTRTVWNNLGHFSKLGHPTEQSEPAPSILLRRPIGLRGQVGRFTVQGIIANAGSTAEVPFGVTNAIVVEVN